MNHPDNISCKEQLVRDVIALLNDRVPYAVLRNYELLPAGNDARDIDIILRRSDFKSVRGQIVSLIDSTGWKIITYLDSDRLVTFVCGRVDGDSVSLVQWDFFFDTSVWGIRLMSADEFLADREFNGFLWHSKAASKFLDKYLYDRAVGAAYPDRYRAVRDAAEHLPAVSGKINRIFGCGSARECDSASRGRLMAVAFVRNLLSRPAGLFAGMGRWAWTYLRNYLMSDTGFSVGFTGPDGSGKTTVIDMMLSRLDDVFGKAHLYYHFRPALFGNLGEVAHKAGVKKEVDRNYSDPHRGGRTSKLSSLLRLTYYTADYVAGYFLKVKSKTRITRLVIFDRYFTDIICDPRRSRIYLPFGFLEAWRRVLIPSLDYNVLLTAPTDVILSRKSELSADEIEEINRRIDMLAQRSDYCRIVNDAAPERAVRDILTVIFDDRHRRMLKRLHTTPA